MEVDHLAYGKQTFQVMVEEGQTLDLLVPMRIEPIPLEGITVQVRSRWLKLGGFYSRQNAGFRGRQWVRDEILEEDPVFVRELIETVPGVSTQTAGFRTAILGRNDCRMSVFVDDFHMPDFNIDHLDPRHIEAMEVYHGAAGMPLKYQMVNRCGVVLIWLRYAGG